MKNRIYFFTGTGNSLKIAKNIAKELPDSELIGIHKDTSLEVPVGYHRIGFVFPNYAGGPPSMVADFIGNMNFPKQGDTYVFVVATYGGNAGGLHAQIGNQLKKRGIKLNYGAKVQMYPNSISASLMLKTANFLARKGDKNSKPIIEDIIAKNQNAIPDLKESDKKRYDSFMEKIHDSDNAYKVNDNCISCGVCKNICPAKNIVLENGKPVFLHNCESCLACFHHCPKKAINLNDKTENQGRYSHPQIGSKDIVAYYN